MVCSQGVATFAYHAARSRVDCLQPTHWCVVCSWCSGVGLLVNDTGYHILLAQSPRRCRARAAPYSARASTVAFRNVDYLATRYMRSRITRCQPTGGSLPANGPRMSRRQSSRRLLGTKPCTARTVSGNATPVRPRPRPRGTAGQASVQHGRKLTDASDKDAGRWARPTWATADRLAFRVDRVVVGPVSL